MNGTRTKVTENILKPDNVNRIKAKVIYRYDNLYRLASEERTALNAGDDPGVAYEKSYTYDDAGNRTQMVETGVGTTYYHHDAANKLSNYGSSPNPPYSGNAQVDYDIKGNMISETLGETETDYTWDPLNRMIQWEKTGETAEAYVYDGDGMRVRKTPDGGTPTDFLLDGKEIAEEITGENMISYVGPGLISSISGSTRLLYHADGIGSTRATTNNYADVTQAEIYDAYGNRLTPSGTAPSFGFAGRERYYTDATGLYYLKARYYKPDVGRFISKDPVGYWEETSPYEYTYGDPMNWVDPDGEKPKKPKPKPKEKDYCRSGVGDNPYFPGDCQAQRMQKCMEKLSFWDLAGKRQCKNCADICDHFTCPGNDEDDRDAVRNVNTCWDRCLATLPKK